MNNFMLDLETLGTTPGCAILSIGLVAFDPFAATVDEVFADDGFYVVVYQPSCLDAMLHVDKGTVRWWSRQSEAARQVLKDTTDPNTSVPLRDALGQMVDYVAIHHAPSKALVWGNGADFDNPIVNVAARHVEFELPWKWGNRCYRTVKNLHEFMEPEFQAPPLARQGTYHNALHDARSQALHMWDLLHTFRTQKKEV